MRRRSLRRRSLQVWLSDTEYEAFKEVAQAMALSVSGLARVCVLAGLSVWRERLAELRKALSDADLPSLSPSPRREKKSSR